MKLLFEGLDHPRKTRHEQQGEGAASHEARARVSRKGQLMLTLLSAAVSLL